MLSRALVFWVLFLSVLNCWTRRTQAIDIQFGQIDSLTLTPVVISFDGSIANPVVFCNLITENDANFHGTPRISSVSASSFTVQLHHPPGDGSSTSASETVNWIVIKQGVYSGGTALLNKYMEAVKITGTRTLNPASETFSTSLASVPMVTMDFQTWNEANSFKNLRVQSASITGFTFDGHYQEKVIKGSGKGDDTPEDVAWLAVQAGSSTTAVGGIDVVLDVITTAQTTDVPSTVTFSSIPSIVGVRAVYGHLMSDDGTDTAWLRRQIPNGNQVSFFIEEDISKSSETQHGLEDIGVMAVSCAVQTVVSGQPPRGPYDQNTMKAICPFVYFSSVPGTVPWVQFTVTTNAGVAPLVYMRNDALPSQSTFDAKDETRTSPATPVIQSPSTSVVYLGVFDDITVSEEYFVQVLTPAATQMQLFETITQTSVNKWFNGKFTPTSSFSEVNIVVTPGYLGSSVQIIFQKGSMATFDNFDSSVSSVENNGVYTLSLAGPEAGAEYFFGVYSETNDTNVVTVVLQTSEPQINQLDPATGRTFGTYEIDVLGVNFGVDTVGTKINFGAGECAIQTISSSQVTCTVPAGEGRVNVSITKDGSTSANKTFIYLAPSIDAVTTSTSGGSPTVGGATVILSGDNFGVGTGVVTVGGQPCVTDPAKYGHTTLECSSPPGSGVGVAVKLTVAGQSVSSTVDYQAPTLTTIIPSSGPTLGGTLVTLVGTNVGPPSAIVSATIGGEDCVKHSHNQTAFLCYTPPGTGSSKQVALTVSSQSVIASFSFSYDRPSISSIHPTVSSTQGTTLTIRGSNFGPVVTPTSSVQVVGSFCAIVFKNDSYIECALSAGTGANLPVSVSQSSQTSNEVVLFSYAKPTITNVHPSVQRTQGGFPVTLSGSSFGLSGSVFANSLPVTIIFHNHTHIVYTSPQGVGLNRPITITVNGQTSDIVRFNYSAPSLIRTDPVGGPTRGTFTITLFGYNFGPSPIVTIGGTVCSSPTVNTAHEQIQCTVSVGQGTNKAVMVTTESGPSNTTRFDYDPPVIESVSPTKGPTSGIIDIIIQGQNFGTSGIVVLGGKICQQTTYDHNSIFVTLPVGRGNNVELNVTVGGQTAKNFSFSYEGPVITGITPTVATSGEVDITLEGSSLDSDGTVSVNGLDCPVSAYGQSSIVCKIPKGQGIVPVVVTTVGGEVSPPFSYRYKAPSVSIVSGTVFPTAGGSTIVVNGESFGTTAYVTVNGRNCTTQTQTDSQIDCTLPEGQGKSQPVVVFVSDQVSSPSGTLDYNPPSVVRILKEDGSPTSGGVNVTLVGNNFGLLGSSVVLFGTSSCPVSAQNHTHITCLLPSGQGQETVRVTVAQQQSSDFLFNYDSPVITAVSPLSGPTSGEAHIYLYGQSFGTSGTVLIGGQLCSPISHNDTVVVCDLAPGSGTNKEVKLTVSSAESNTDFIFSYLPPSISFISPANASTEGQLPLTLVGTNFFTSGSVFIGSKSCTPLSHSHELITCTIPSGEGANLPVTVTVSQQTSNRANFSYNQPIIDTVGPPNAPTDGQSFTLTLTGSNFGTTGLVLVGSEQCTVSPASFYQQRSIKCLMPPGVGTVDVSVTTASGTSNKVSYSYARPTITSIAPSSGPTQGLAVVIQGNNFGSNLATVMVGTHACTGTNTHSIIDCTIEAGAGRLLPVVVTVGGQTSQEDIPFSFNPPSLISLTPNLIDTNGNVNVTVSGTNFGYSGATVNITVGGVLSPIFLRQHQSMVVTVPPGAGKDKPVLVVVEGQYSAVKTLLSYNKPTLTSITSNDCSLSGNTVVECPTLGQVLITLTGTNFGPSGANVTVNGLHCASPTHNGATPHSKLTCVLPPGLGFDLPVVISNEGQASDPLLLAYSGPIFYPGSLQEVVDETTPEVGTTRLLLNTTEPGRKILLQGKFLKLGSQTPEVRFGLATSTWDNLEYSCTVDETLTNSTHVYCTLPGGVGGNLTFQLYDTQQYSPRSLDSISYPRPEILPGTIRSTRDAPGTKGTSVSGEESQGEVILFDVRYVRTTASVVSVTYGQALPLTIQCSFVTLTDVGDQISTLSCKTQPGNGLNYVFQVTALNQVSDPGTDVYSYPTSPEIYGVFGCENTPPKTINCPTAGGNALIINGEHFAASVSVKIGTADCLNVNKVNSTQILCTLPVGAGVDSPVVVLSGVLFSRSVNLVSYAIPVPTKISGCPVQSGSDTQECDRNGLTRVTIEGTNFGASNALVLIGGELCTNVLHDTLTPHEKITCDTPSGTQENRAVLVIQDGGEISSAQLFLSYKQCAAGTYDSSTTIFKDIPCTNCSAGTFSASAGQVACTPCEDGEFTPVNGSTVCEKCTRGSFSKRISSSLGASACTLCQNGTFNSVAGQGECLDCDAGSYTNTSGQTVCVSCVRGYKQPERGKTLCTPCDAGSFAFALGSSDCTFCPAGTYTDLVGQSTCRNCPAGRAFSTVGADECTKCSIGQAIGSTGQAICLACGDGTFANDTELTACLTCPPGKFSKNVDSLVGPTICSDCDVGKYVPTGGQGVCLNCPKGEFAASKGASACQKCAPGKSTSNLEQQSSCTNCTKGHVATESGLATCSVCTKGSYAATAGLSVCKLCEIGRFQALDGEDTCTLCEAGTGNPSTGQVSCPDCLPGEFTNVTGSTICNRCPPGTRSTTAGLTICTACDAGSFASAQGQAQCKDCNQGFIAATSGLTTCSACVAGKIASTTGLSVCTNCTSGKFSSAVGGDFCFSCPKGTYSPNDGASICLSCEAGREQPNAGKSFCSACDKGKIAGSTGQSECIACDQGTFANTTGLSACFSCPPGSSQPDDGKDGCILCGTGFFTAASGQANCEACTFGKFGPIQGLTECSPCSRGKFMDEVGRDACTNCTKGTITASEGLFQCNDCPIGRFNTEDGLSTCAECGQGYHQPDPGQTSCDICGTGTSQPGTGQSVCIDCAVGFFQDESGKSSCQPCALGRVTATTKLSVCSNCTAGTFRGAGSTSTATCEPCPPGFFSGKDGASACDPCPAGSRQDESGKSFCELCIPGKANSATGQKICSDCSGGRFSNTSGALECLVCSAGNFSEPASSVCSRCDKGKFSNVAGLSSCVVCAPGSANDLQGQTECGLCLPGTFASGANSFTCTNCTTGTAVGGSGATGCPPCSKGSFAAVTGSTVCTPCAKGSHQPADRQSSCTECLAGEFTSSTGQANCIKCGIGRYASTTGLSTCDPCDAGTVQPAQGQASCKACDEGKAQAAKGQGVCDDCDSGFYANTTGLSKCFACEAGFTSTKTTVGASKCSTCDLGRFNGAQGQPVCLDCPFGTFANTTGLSVCYSCAPGRKADFQAAQFCTECAEGTFSVTGGANCLLCGAGTFAELTAQTLCDNCPTGRFETRSGSSECQRCAVGSFMSAQGAVQCDVCPTGTFSNTTEQSFCHECQAGQFQNLTNTTQCLPCPLGKATSITRQSNCASCPVGRFMNYTGALECMDCPEGRFQDEIGTTVCKPCATGRFLSNKGLSVCLFCSAGTYANETGSTQCSDCLKGSVQPENGKSSCNACPVGTFQGSTKQTACVSCSPGSFINVNGSTACLSCDKGYFQARSRETSCQPCDEGTFDATGGQSECQRCFVGRFGNTTALTDCFDCGTGEVQASTGRTECVECRIGQFQGSTRQTACLACEPGTYIALNGSTSCLPCDKGYFQNLGGQTSCKPCEEGTFDATGGQSQCINCAKGRFGNLTALTDCYDCSVGRVQPAAGQTLCTECSVGRFQGFTRQTACVDCSPGSYIALNGSTSCLPCDEGYFQNLGQQTACKPCEAGRSDNIGGQSQCSDCVAGRFGNVSAALDCSDCPVGRVQASSGRTICEECGVGTFQSSTKQTACVSCSPGSFINVNGSTSCLPCDKGYFQALSRETSCKPCDEGTFDATGGQSVCISCSVGRFGNDTGLTDCIDCAVGRVQPGTRSTICDACSVGRFQASTKQTVCIDCSPGSFINVNGSTACLPCDKGYFQARSRETSCQPCDEGTFDATGGQSACIDCEAGRFGNVTALTECKDCQPGTVQSSTGQLACDRCLFGQFQASARQRVCKACEPGSFAASNGSTSCQPCARGFFQSLSGQTICQPCATGKFDETGGVSVCIDCSVGRFSNDTGRTTCSDCPAGTVQASSGRSVCRLCQPGSFQPARAQTACVACQPGSFSAKNASTTCDACNPGQFQALSSQTRCNNCTSGSISASIGQSVCADCGVGTFQPNNGTTFCLDCNPGEFQGQVGKPTCDPCPKRTFNNAGGQSACKACDPGTFGNQTGLQQCFDCPVGRVQPSERQERCEECVVGRFINAPRQKECLPCPAGSFGNVTELTTCQACDRGRAQGITGQSACEDCARGRFALNPGLTTCDDCGRGRYTNETGQVDCIDCSAGFFQSLTGRISCDECPLGRASPSVTTTRCSICTEGTFSGPENRQNVGGRTTCSECQLGRYNDLTERSICSNCSLGRAQSQRGGTVCSSCSPGRFSQSIGATSCTACPSGYRSEQEFGSTTCLICEAGKTSRITNKETQGHTCEFCIGNAVARTAGLAQCTSCQLNSIADESGTTCNCDVGFYANPVVGSDSLFTCQACPQGASCDTVGVTLENMLTDCGFWREDNTTIDFHRCIVPSHCPCGQLATSEASSCSGNRTGPLCSLCPPGFTAQTITSPCEECPDQDTAIAASVGISALLLFALVFMYWLVLRMDRSLMQEAKEMAEWKKENDWAWFEDDGDAAELTDQQKSKKFNMYDKDGAMQGMVSTPQAKPNFTYKMKILLGFFQISVNLAVALDIPWPSLFQSFIVKFDIVNFNFLRLSNAECVVEANFYNRLLIVGFTPLVVGSLVFVFFLLPMLIRDSRQVEMDYDLRAAQMARSKKKFWKLFLFSLFLIYPGVCSTVLRLFVCREINGKVYLLADMTKECYDEEWNNFAIIAAVFIIIYPIGIPAFFYYMLSKNLGRLHLPDVRVQLGFLYEAYHISLWWFELIDMMNKLFLTSILAFIPVNSQMPMGISWAVGYVCVLLLLHPYVRKGDDFLHLLAQTEIFLFLLAGYFFLENPEFDNATDIAMSIMLILLVTSILLLFLFQIARVLKIAWREWREERDAAKEAEAEAKAEQFDVEDEESEEEAGETFDLRNLRLPAGALMTRNPLFSSTAELGDDDLSDSPSDVSTTFDGEGLDNLGTESVPVGEAVIATEPVGPIMSDDEDPWKGEDEETGSVAQPKPKLKPVPQRVERDSDESSDDDVDSVMAMKYSARLSRKR